jgi:cell wall-associated NlpC family hydrolase
MNYFILLISLCCALFGNACLAIEVLSETAAGVTIYSTDEASNQTQAVTETQHNSWQDKAQEVLINALSLTGIKYKYGGSSPATGFDCSGFVRYVFHNAANLTLPPTARAIAQIGKSVKKDDLQPGDLVFFNTLKSAFSHVGIYLGDNKFIHAPRTGAAVRVESMQNSYWASRFEGAQRLDEEVEKSSKTAVTAQTE